MGPIKEEGRMKEQGAVTTRQSQVRQDKLRQDKLRQPKVHTQLGRAAVQIFVANDRINQILIEHLDPAAWKAKPPGNVRTIAAIFTHMHNVRTKWIRLSPPHLKTPSQLNRAHCTQQQARTALAASAALCAEMLADALGDGSSRIR